MSSGRTVALPLLFGVVLVAANFAMAFAVSHLLFWLYFEAGFHWTGDAVVPQIQAFLVPVVQGISALIYVPIGLGLRPTRPMALGVALLWPPISGTLGLLGPLGLFVLLVLTFPVIIMLGVRREPASLVEPSGRSATSRTDPA